MTILMDKENLFQQVDAIRKGRDGFVGVEPEITDRTSKSKAMDEFEKRFREIDEFIKKYRMQLDKDINALIKAASTLTLADKTMSSSINSTVPKIQSGTKPK